MVVNYSELHQIHVMNTISLVKVKHYAPANEKKNFFSLLQLK